MRLRKMNVDYLANILRRNKNEFGRVLSIDYKNLPYSILDLSSNNSDLMTVNMSDPKKFSDYLGSVYEREGSIFGVGLYDENRCIYDHSDLFRDEERRTLHLGIDLWVKPSVDVLCPYNGIVHSFKNNKGNGDYGPTIILEHEIENRKFYTLYGHLSLPSLDGLKEGMKVLKGNKIGEVGNYPENGNWASHLHFELIRDMLGNKGDFPGVAKMSERERFLFLCPNPNLILNLYEDNKVRLGR